MRKIKLFLCVALFGVMSFGAFSAYDHLTMSEEERFLLTNVEALTSGETPGFKVTSCVGLFTTECVASDGSKGTNPLIIIEKN